MKPGHESQTSVFVCAGRAIAHGKTDEPRFSDPTAFALLPERAQRRVERIRNDVPPKSLRERVVRVFTRQQSNVMVARTVAIDESIRAAASPQVVILGAGLDGRAWRMDELRDVVVFEVDHPDTQRMKRDRAASLSQVSRDVRFVPVDFTRDSLDAALAGAGHDATRPTTWIWEGVVMYLEPAAIEATLRVIADRSAPQSHLVIVYHAPALASLLVGFVVSRVGEPLRSSFTAADMRAMLAKFDFAALTDRGMNEIGATMAPDVARVNRRIKHLRIVDAVKT